MTRVDVTDEALPSPAAGAAERAAHGTIVGTALAGLLRAIEAWA